MRVSVAVLVAFFASVQITAAEIHLVMPDGTGDYPTIQAALDAAVAGDIIELADGTFTGEGNRDVDFLGKAVTVRSRSGDPEACIISCGGSETEPHRAFYFGSGEDPASVLQDIAMRGGYAEEGGGIFCAYPGSPTITGCILWDNIASLEGGGLYYGGDLMVSDCRFEGNVAGRYGGGARGYDGHAIFTLCRFTGNGAGSGGGIDCSHSSIEVTDCVFENNTAMSGGALGGIWAGAAVNGCVFSGNTASGIGGAAYFEGSRFTDCFFIGNRASGAGGAFGSYSGVNFFTSCVFSANAAPDGGAVHLSDLGGGRFVGCTLSGNETAASSAAIVGECNFECTARQTVIAFTVGGKGVLCLSSGPFAVTCCNVFGNEGGDWVGCLEGQLGVDGNIWSDPLFCDRESGDFRLEIGSPCAPEANPDCGLIGALPVGCGSTPAREISWGAVKSLFRGGGK